MAMARAKRMRCSVETQRVHTGGLAQCGAARAEEQQHERPEHVFPGPEELTLRDERQDGA